MIIDLNNGKANFESEIQALKGTVSNLGAHLIIDSTTRKAYARQIELMSNELRQQATNGSITWKEAALQAHETRNMIMQIMRFRTTPLGVAIAESIKKQGATLDDLIIQKTHKLYGSTEFSQLTTVQKNNVYAEITVSAGRSKPSVTALMSKLSWGGRSVIFLSLAWSVYNVMNSQDKVTATIHEAATTGAGIVGGMAGGAAAGLVCGPGAFLCSTVGAFAGGALAAFGVSLFWK